MVDTPIADYALISDCHSAALVSRAGSVDWLCLPRFDSPSIFGRLLGERGGHWSISALDSGVTRRRYVERTMVLETTFESPTGRATLTDAMALGSDTMTHDLGAGAPGVLLRTVRGVEGRVAFDMEFAPRPEYGLIAPLVRQVDGGLAARGGACVMRLSTPTAPSIDGAVARLRFEVHAGEEAPFALHHHTTSEPPPRVWSPADIDRSHRATVEGWQRWSGAHQRYEGPWSDLVYHSGRVLQALMYQPTGAIVAAPSTSLPEDVGGERNWDYRFAWVRDASLTLDALWVAACPDEARKFFGWMAGTVASQLDAEPDIQIVFGVGGEHDLTERTLSHLPGWRGSRPVRVGNGAWTQRQLDVYGELLGAAERLSDRIGELDDPTRRFLARLADVASERWREKDQGIWETRDEPRHFVFSKVMCWVALDRAIALAGRLGAEDRVTDWTSSREEIRTAVLAEGWSETAGAFTQSFGSNALDASNLMIPIVGFLSGDDPRVVATVDATADRLTDGRGLVYRYLADDGLPGQEGLFLLCTFWLAQAQAMAGRVDAARETFERAIAHANDVGLLSEEVGPGEEGLLGNFPQAFSHIGLINAAWAISQAG
jgi:GH15 family glucan-1,4-alpha-glucosidase